MATVQNNLEFVFSDALLLLAIAFSYRGEGVNLQNIIATGDYIDHSIFNGLELRHGLSLLKRAGYIDEKDGLFFLSGATRDYWQPFKESRKSANTLLKEIIAFLGVDRLSSRIVEDNPQWEYAGLSDETVHQAYLNYINNITPILKK